MFTFCFWIKGFAVSKLWGSAKIYRFHRNVTPDVPLVLSSVIIKCCLADSVKHIRNSFFFPRGWGEVEWGEVGEVWTSQFQIYMSLTRWSLTSIIALPRSFHSFYSTSVTQESIFKEWRETKMQATTPTFDEALSRLSALYWRTSHGVTARCRCLGLAKITAGRQPPDSGKVVNQWKISF